MTIYLIRHGKTEANEKRLYCGNTDLSLSRKGREEVQSLRYDISNVRFVTSGMKRANETLRILFGDVPFTEEPRFREVDFGVFEMRGYEELKDLPEYQAWISGDHERNVPPGGESGEQMRRRVSREEAVEQIREYVERFLLIDGTLWEKAREPMYQVCVFGLGYALGGCLFYLAYTTLFDTMQRSV